LGDILSIWRFLSFPGLDFLPQLNSVFPLRKNAGASSSLVLHSSPLNVLMGSSGKEENESHEPSAESKRAYLGKQEPKDAMKQVSPRKEYPV
jgi:protein NEDD1